MNGDRNRKVRYPSGRPPTRHHPSHHLEPRYYTNLTISPPTWPQHTSTCSQPPDAVSSIPLPHLILNRHPGITETLNRMVYITG